MKRKRRGSGEGHRIRLPFWQQALGTLGCVALYRLLANIPLPFVDRELMAGLLASRGTGIADFLSGGVRVRMSVAALGVSPYISASIMLQLLSAVVPVISLLQRSGPVGQKKLRHTTLVLAGAIAVLSGTFTVSGYRQAGILPAGFWTGLVVPVAVMSACAIGLAMLGTYIDEKLFGRGVSILILAGVLSSLPGNLAMAGEAMAGMPGGYGPWMFLGGFALFFVLVFWLVNYRIDLKLSYSGKFAGKTEDLSSVSVLPVVALPGGVMPVIFASYFLSIPSMFGNLTGEVPVILRALDMSSWFDPEAPLLTLGVLVYGLLVFVFGRVSQMMSVNAGEVAENLRRGGCTIEGVPAGPETEEYLARRIRAMTDVGSLGLCLVAVIPAALAAVTGVRSIGYAGTSVLLAVSVVQELLSEARSELTGLGYMRCMKPMLKGRRSGNPFALLEWARRCGN